MATIIDGKELSKKLKEQMKDRVAQMRQQGIVPKLVVVLVGNNSASEVYVRNKHKACGEVGIESEVIKMPEETTQQELLDVVKGLNEDRTSLESRRWVPMTMSTLPACRPRRVSFCCLAVRKRESSPTFTGNASMREMMLL